MFWNHFKITAVSRVPQRTFCHVFSFIHSFFSSLTPFSSCPLWTMNHLRVVCIHHARLSIRCFSERFPRTAQGTFPRDSLSRVHGTAVKVGKCVILWSAQELLICRSSFRCANRPNHDFESRCFSSPGSNPGSGAAFSYPARSLLSFGAGPQPFCVFHDTDVCEEYNPVSVVSLELLLEYLFKVFHMKPHSHVFWLCMYLPNTQPCARCCCDGEHDSAQPGPWPWGCSLGLWGKQLLSAGLCGPPCVSWLEALTLG